MKKPTAFWDSSALVPLCIHEITSRQAQYHLHRLLPVVWWASLVEVHSAISRLRRGGKLSEVEKRGDLSRLDTLSRGWREILPGDQLRSLAARLLDAYELRAADSLQLAAALTWRQERPSKRNFVCGDEHLGKAADSAGFSVLQLSRAAP
jgi:predicted nucleic acid-binding protein